MKTKVHTISISKPQSREQIRKELAKVWGWNSPHVQMYDELVLKATLYESYFPVKS
jgi:hypothetical protein